MPVLSEVERLEKAGKKQGNVLKYQFWQHHNKPIELWSENVIKQKIDYIRNNPVVSGFVTNAIDWKYSSARNSCSAESPDFAEPTETKI